MSNVIKLDDYRKGVTEEAPSVVLTKILGIEKGGEEIAIVQLDMATNTQQTVLLSQGMLEGFIAGLQLAMLDYERNNNE